MTKGIKNRQIYVVQLDEAVMLKRKFRDRNPNFVPGKSPLYVGMTGLTPEERFANHRAGWKANKYVRDYGLRLRADLYERYNPLFYDDAVSLEVALAEQLRREGHPVWQG